MSDFRIFPTELKQLHGILSWISETAKTMGFLDRQIREIELAIEEVIVNIIHHGYKNYSGRIEISLLNLSNRLEITVKDKGPPFNPLTYVAKVAHEELQERQEGGLGIHFLRHFMDEINYQRGEVYNILRLVKYKKTSPSKE